MEYGAYLQAIMSLVGYAANQQQQAKAQALLQQAMDAYKNQDLPALQHIAAQVLPPSAMQAIQADPHAVTAQYGALSGLQDIIQGNGLAAEDRAAINRIGNEVDLAGRGGRAAITSQSEANGTMGGGQQLAAMEGLNEGANQRLSQAGLDEKSLALKNRLSALGQSGALAGQIRGQAFSEAADKAKAADWINAQNAAARTQADLANNSNAQALYEDQMQKLAGSTGLATPMVGLLQQKGASMQQLGSGLGAALNDASAKPPGSYNGGGYDYPGPDGSSSQRGGASDLSASDTSEPQSGNPNALSGDSTKDTSGNAGGYTQEEIDAMMKRFQKNPSGGSYDAYDN